MKLAEKYRRLPRGRRIAWTVAGGVLSLVAAGGIALWGVVWSMRRPFTPPCTSGWRTGDIFFSAGNSWKSLCVRAFGDASREGSTHCGFILMRHGHPMLVHMSTGKGRIAVESVEEYARLNDVSAITAMRLPAPPDTVALRHHLERLVRTGKRFDTSFNHRDTTEYYCTEFVVRELEKLGDTTFLPLLRCDYIYPSQLEQCGHLLPMPK